MGYTDLIGFSEFFFGLNMTKNLSWAWNCVHAMSIVMPETLRSTILIHFHSLFEGPENIWKLGEDGSLQISRATESHGARCSELVHGQGIASEVGTPTWANGLEMRGRCVCWSVDIFRMGTRFMEIREFVVAAFASNDESIILNHHLPVSNFTKPWWS
jgi:hypothetical protein